MSPRWQKIAGVDLPEQSLIEPRSGTTGISRNGGQTVILPNGQEVPATGFQPVDQSAALLQARDNNNRAAAAQPLIVGNPANGAAAIDAAQASGLGAKVQKLANEEIGSLPFAQPIMQAAGIGPEIAPATQRAQSQIDVRNNAARSILLGSPGRQTVQAQKWVEQLLPTGAAFANPATESAKIGTIVNALKADHDQYRQLALDSHTAPADRTKYVQTMRQIENTVRMFTEPPAAQAAPAQPAQPAAPAPPPPPKIGEMRDGFAFQGGNPADPASWMKVQ
jgi:hypothetical protein